MWNRAAGCLGARVEIDERGGPRKVGYGGFLTTTTTGFRDVAASGGGTLVLPWDDPWTVTVSAGPLLLHRDAAWWPGAAAWGFVGWRGFNYHGSYAMAWGFTVGYERAFAGPSTLTMGVELDGLVLALPAMLVIEAIRGPRD